MSSKSRRKRGKHGKRRKVELTPALTAAEQPVASETRAPASPSPVARPAAGVPASVSKPAAVRYPYFAGEMKRIGIIAAIMLTVLVILSRVLP